MAKMFYTMEEVCQKLGKSDNEVRDMVSSGQIQEFRDRDKLMFKVEQIDLLAGGNDDTGELDLDLSSGSGLGLAGSGSGLGLKDDSGLGLSSSHGGSGLGLEASDPGSTQDFGDTAADTHITDAIDGDDLSLEAVGSGSGLLDLTQESDDTSLGAELLEEVYSSDDNIEIPSNASGLFEAAGAESPGNDPGIGIASVPMVAEVYDGAGSGLGVGLMIGAFASLVCIAIMVFAGVQGTTPALATKMAESMWMWVGILAGVTVVFGAIGLFIGKASE